MTDTPIQSRRRTIRRIDWAARAAFFLYASVMLAMPICLVQICHDLQLTNTQAGSFGMITSLQGIAMLLIAGVLAARWGKIRLLRAAMLIVGAGLAVFTQANGYATLLIALLVIGVGSGLIEGLLTPLVEDLHPNDDGKKQIQLHAFWPIGVVFSTITIGELLTRGVDWRWVYAGLALAAALASLLYPRHRRTAALNLPRSRADFSHALEILRLPRFKWIAAGLMFAGGAEGGVTFWTAAYVQVGFDAAPRTGAWATALFALGMAVGRLVCARIAPRLGLHRLLLLSTVAAIAVCSLFPFIQTLPVLFALMFVIGLSIACFWPSLQTYGARMMPVDPTMLMIFLSCSGLPGFTSSIFLMGWLSDSTSLTFAFAIVPVYLLGLLTVLIREAIHQANRPD